MSRSRPARRWAKLFLGAHRQRYAIIRVYSIVSEAGHEIDGIYISEITDAGIILGSLVYHDFRYVVKQLGVPRFFMNYIIRRGALNAVLARKAERKAALEDVSTVISFAVCKSDSKGLLGFPAKAKMAFNIEGFFAPHTARLITRSRLLGRLQKRPIEVEVAQASRLYTGDVSLPSDRLLELEPYAVMLIRAAAGVVVSGMSLGLPRNRRIYNVFERTRKPRDGYEF